MNYFKFFLLIFIAFYSCKKGNLIDSTNDYSRSSQKQIEDYYFYGDIHNEYMEDLCLNYIDTVSSTVNQALYKINAHVTNFQPQNTSLGANLSTMVDNYSQDWQFLLHDSLKIIANSQEMSNYLDTALTHGFIDSFERNLLEEIFDLSNQDVSFMELDSLINGWIDDWEAQGYLEGNNDGLFSGIVLAIGHRSTQWWINNPDCQYNDSARILPWVAADIVGAGVGLGVSIINHYVTGSSNPNATGISMVAGAIVGSTGLVGRAGRAIARWW